MPRVAVALGLVLWYATAAHAQLRDHATAPATGTASIAGTVVTDEPQPQPVRRATVVLNSQEPPVGRTAVTDDNGRFVFTNLPAARYLLNASKRGWAGGSYGARTIGRPGRTLPLAAGERATATIRMVRGAVISGTILDQFGQPMNAVSLRVMRYGYSFVSGERTLNLAGSSQSGPDERGAYRIYGLTPGEYYVVVTNVATRFSNGSDLHLTSDVDVEAAMQSAQPGSTAPPDDVPEPTVGFAQIFYPGTTAIAQATPIALRAGEERSGVDFTVTYLPTVHVEGVVTSPTDMPTGARVTLVANDPTAPSQGFDGLHNAIAGPDGRFSFSELAPGPYVLSAQAVVPGASPDARPEIVTATTDLDVPADGATGVALALQQGVSVTGIVRYDGASPAPNLASVRVTLQPAQERSGVTVSTSGTATITDGRFNWNGISPGRYRLNIAIPVPHVRVRSATVFGQDALDGAVDIHQNATDAVIVLTDRISRLTGKVQSNDNASADCTLILFSADRADWRPRARRILTARAAEDGSYVFADVPPGEYQLAPVEDVEPGEWFDPAFLQGLAPSALRVTIGEGETKTQDIRVGG